MSKEAMKLALEALNVLLDEWTPARQAQLKGMATVTVLEEALAKQEQGEPVAWAMLHDNGVFIDAIHPDEHARIEGEYTHPLYTTTQQRKPLTYEQMDKAAMKLAQCMDYPWAHMPEDGKREMRNHAKAIIEAVDGIAPQAKPVVSQMSQEMNDKVGSSEGVSVKVQEGWKSIESAPKIRGQKILTWGLIPESHGHSEEKWLHSISEWNADGWISQASIPFGNRFIPTHWMPLPAFPQGSDK